MRPLLSAVVLASLGAGIWCRPSPKHVPSTVGEIPAFEAAIVRRAAALIASPSAWSRDDGKDCAVSAGSFSLRCALERATAEAARRANRAPSAGASSSPTLASCTLRGEGSCGPLFDDLPVFIAVAPAKGVTTGVWRSDMHPAGVWAAKSVDAVSPMMARARSLVDAIAHKKYSARLIDYNNDPATTFADIKSFLKTLEDRVAHQTQAEVMGSPERYELEIYSGGSGIIRTYRGWFAISGFSSRDSVLRFEIDTTNQVPPSSIDREILRRANEILASDAVWNRADDRNCPAGAKTWSIYCALHDASLEVAGGFHHRRPALEIVRVIVDERTKGKSYNHRLMGYNNDPATHLEDVRSLFAEALARADSLIAAAQAAPPNAH